MNKRIFFGLSGGLGPVLRSLPLADKFRQAGDFVSFSVYGESSASFIKRQGYSHLDDDDPVMPSEEKLLPPSPVFYDLDHYYAAAGLLDEAFAESWVRHRISMLEKAGADLAVADMSPHTVIAARYLGIPVVSITQACFHPYGEPMYAWGDAPRNLPRVTPVINKILAKLRLPAIRSMEDLNLGDLDLVPGIPETDPISHPGVCYVGQLAHKIDAPRPAWIEKLGAEPYVLVYPGRLRDSSGSSGLRLLQSVYEAFGGTDLPVVIASQEPLPKAFRKRQYRNIRAIPYFTEELLEACGLFIHHGGHGSCLSSIMAGVPSLIVPTQTEREYNARKVYELGIGEYMLPGAFTAEHLRGLARYMMHDDYALKARKLRNAVLIRGYGGAEEAYDACRRLLTSTRKAGGDGL
ncbi:glycosyltransferase [Paenibacillus chitinolyticus]|uniref:glycosyltransferase n=1 Tax=Paenibacillus chitinolyticus TaxID=79263 RepID=UPI00386358CB